MPNHDVECPCGDEWGKHSKDDIGYFCLEPDCKCENSEADVLRAVLSERVVQLAEAQRELDKARLDVDRTSTENERLVCEIRHADALAALLREADELIEWLGGLIELPRGEDEVAAGADVKAWRERTKEAAWRAK